MKHELHIDPTYAPLPEDEDRSPTWGQIIGSIALLAWDYRAVLLIGFLVVVLACMGGSVAMQLFLPKGL